MNVLSRLTRHNLPVLVALIFSLAAPTIVAQNPSPTWSQDDTLRIAKEVQKRLGSLTNYGTLSCYGFPTLSFARLRMLCARPGDCEDTT
jgi:hypothetical protein